MLLTFEVTNDSTKEFICTLPFHKHVVKYSLALLLNSMNLLSKLAIVGHY